MGALANKGASICSFMGGTRADTRAALALADQGMLRNDVEFFSLEEAALALDRLKAGQLKGRAVIVP
jgi:propanol-preferring alcohol dehydrogenase